MGNMTNCVTHDWPGTIGILGFMAFMAFVLWICLRDRDK